MSEPREVIIVEIVDGKPVVSIVVTPRGNEPSEAIKGLALNIARLV